MLSYSLSSGTRCQHVAQLLNYPTGKSKVELRTREGRSLFNATLAEDDLDEDSTSKEGNKGVPPFHGFSKAGSAKGQVVYANVCSRFLRGDATVTRVQLGRIEDYQELKRREISLKGKIVLVRYGGVFRGLKVSLAEEAGAVGSLSFLPLYRVTFDLAQESLSTLIHSKMARSPSTTATPRIRTDPLASLRQSSAVAYKR